MTPNTPAAAPEVVLLHSSRFGQAERIADVVAEELRAQGLAVARHSLGDSPLPQLAQRAVPCAAVVIVASIRYGHFAPQVQQFIDQNLPVLQAVPSAFASVSLTARKPEKNTPQTHTYTRKFLAQMAEKGWRPTWPGVFAGALRYPLYNWLDKTMIRFIMRITGGETDPSTNVEYTDWQQVRAWAQEIGKAVAAK